MSPGPNFAIGKCFSLSWSDKLIITIKYNNKFNNN